MTNLGSSPRTCADLETASKPVFYMMQKDEKELLQPWLDYHLRLTKPENVYVYDNGSTNDQVLEALRRAELIGVNVNYAHNSSSDFENKGQLFLHLYQRLVERDTTLTHFFPLDCDEFVAVPDAQGRYTSDPKQILRYLDEELKHETRPHNFRVTVCLNNVTGTTNEFTQALHKKVYLGRSATLNRMDTGFHHMVPASTEEELFVPSRVGYLHFHNRSYSSTIRAAREKLKTRVNDFHPETLLKFWEDGGRGRHLVKYFTNSRDWYYRRFQGKETTSVDCARWFEALGYEQPYSSTNDDDALEFPQLLSIVNYHRFSSEDLAILNSHGYHKPTTILALGDNYAGIPNGNTAYSEETGFGWTEGGSVKKRKRPYMPTVLSQFALSFKPARYRVNVPNGHYRVAVFGADSQFDNHYVTAYFNGEPAPEVRPLKGEYYVAESMLEVVGGYFDIDFDSSKDNWIASLIVVEPVAFVPSPIPQVTASTHEIQIPHFDVPWTRTNFAAPLIAKNSEVRTGNRSPGDYLTIIKSIVDQFLPHQSSVGSIIDPELGKEHQYASPSFAHAALYLGHQLQDSRYLAAGRAAFVHSLRQLTARAAASAHEDFYTFQITMALDVIKGFVPQPEYADYINALRTMNPYSIYRSPVGGSDTAGQNWNIIAAAGEYALHKRGARENISFVHNSISLQGRHFTDPWGLYSEGPLVYDLKPRVFALAMLLDGYDPGDEGPPLRDALEASMTTSLLLQASNGELLPGGRSNRHVWNDALECAFFEMAASYSGTRRTGDAPTYRGAARAALSSIKKWQTKSGVQTLKNWYPPEFRVGYEPYTSDSHYTCFAAATLALAHKYAVSQDNSDTVPPPSQTATYTLDAINSIGRAVMSHKGNQVVVDAGKNPRQNPVGITRVALHRGTQRFVISDGLVKNASFSRPAGAHDSLAAGIGWTDTSGQVWLANKTSSGMSRATVLEASSDPVIGARMNVLYELDQASPSFVHEAISISEANMVLRYTVPVEDAVTHFSLPLPAFDGRHRTSWTIQAESDHFRIANGSTIIHVQTSVPSTPRLASEEYAHRDGLYQVARFENMHSSDPQIRVWLA